MANSNFFLVPGESKEKSFAKKPELNFKSNKF
jgi:hypothetical protein